MNRISQTQPDLSKVHKLLRSKELKVINLGLTIFAESLQNQGISTIQVDWQPAAGGDDELNSILSDLNDLF